MRYRVLKTSFIGGALVEPGAVVELPEGVKPGRFLEPVASPAAPSLARRPASRKG